jgi:hypothetical protein
MDAETVEAERRRNELKKLLSIERANTNKRGRRLERQLSVLYWLQLVVGGVATLGSLIDWVRPWMLSIAAAVVTTCAVVARETKWREKANLFYARRNMAAGLMGRLEFEMPNPITCDAVAAVSKEFRQRRADLDTQMVAAVPTGSGARADNELASDHPATTATHNS